MPEPCVEGHECTPCAVLHYVFFGIVAVVVLTLLFFEVRRRISVRRYRKDRELAALGDKVHRR